MLGVKTSKKCYEFGEGYWDLREIETWRRSLRTVLTNWWRKKKRYLRINPSNNSPHLTITISAYSPLSENGSSNLIEMPKSRTRKRSRNRHFVVTSHWLPRPGAMSQHRCNKYANQHCALLSFQLIPDVCYCAIRGGKLQFYNWAAVIYL